MEIIQEGKTRIFLEKFYSYRGPGKKQAGFYNPTLEIDRDMNVIFCQYIANNGAKYFLDGLASSGIRGIRIANEVEGDIEVDINDINKKSYELIRKNIELNKAKANALNENFCILLCKKKYDYIDIDPYGSPIPFIPCIFKGIRKKAYVSITATDTATLCGVYKKACIRKYHSIPLRGQAMKEIGMRILIGYIAKQAASYEYSFEPILSFSYSHFFRTYGILQKGARKANESINKIGWIYWQDGWHTKKFDKPPEKNFAGPLWIGKLHDEKILREMKKLLEEKELRKKKEIGKYLDLFIEENGLPILYYESNYVAKEIKAKQPKIYVIIERLKDKGYEAGRTHFEFNAFKTSAPYEEVKGVFK